MHALFLSPHLDDVAFSCGGTAAALAAGRGGEWRCTVATVFTRSVPDPTGFALDCQLDKGLPAEIDYMARRRAEDQRACDALGAACVHLDLPEAPHRGYGSAAALFTGVRSDDGIEREVRAALEELYDADPPDLLFVPSGCGGHVDHRVTIAAAAAANRPGPAAAPTLHYRDAPYVLRDPEAPGTIGAAGGFLAAEVSAALGAKLDACACYATQLGFQFGGEERMRRLLTEFAADEAARAGSLGGRPGDQCERFAPGTAAPASFPGIG